MLLRAVTSTDTRCAADIVTTSSGYGAMSVPSTSITVMLCPSRWIENMANADILIRRKRYVLPGVKEMVAFSL